MTTFNTGINSLLQFHAPEHMRGQISSLYMLSLRGGMSIGNLIAGPVITQIGISRFLLINGCLVIAYHLWRKSAWNDRTLAPS
jgi:predicted MFS family arabinose efflux permease